MARRMSWRRLFEGLAGLPFVSAFPRGAAAQAKPKMRVRPGDPAWPSDAAWDELNRQVEGRLIKVRLPLAACVGASPDPACAQVFKGLNPYFLGDEVGLTQSLAGSGPGRRSRASTRSRPKRPPMSWPQSTSPARTISGSWSRAGATATRARRTRPTRC